MTLVDTWAESQRHLVCREYLEVALVEAARQWECLVQAAAALDKRCPAAELSLQEFQSHLAGEECLRAHHLRTPLCERTQRPD